MSDYEYRPLISVGTLHGSEVVPWEPVTTDPREAIPF